MKNKSGQATQYVFIVIIGYQIAFRCGTLEEAMAFIAGARGGTIFGRMSA